MAKAEPRGLYQSLKIIWSFLENQFWPGGSNEIWQTKTMYLLTLYY